MMRIISIFSILILTSCFFVSCSNDNESIGAQDDIYLSIPDTRFETILVNSGIDTDGIINQQMLRKDAEQVTRLNLNFISKKEGEIRDLKGIEGFKNLKRLYAIQNALTSVDLSSNLLLDSLCLAGNMISNIDLSHNPNLSWVDIDANELRSITGLSNALHLKTLRLSFNLLEEFSIHNESVEAILISDNNLKSFIEDE